ncbi:putative dolichyl pyrophosphate Man9GlcNAc2 alpha-1,3-glucosyltransferase [Convolutriloba macropyga]|uniref:putative dolichyl pyrophosphate Man9GlcNAc2 alpha-1,3-glucosyltransferase n=1 Tax=Convolutriloba macropyga TaxID=536237 RepID=UPI003F520918
MSPGMNEVSIVLVALLVSWILSTSSYSGFRKPPMHGDYEAQRHWMELAINLPISELYEPGPDNNLSYWGLDYPPVTVYHSYINGKFAQLVNEKWVELNVSHGVEDYGHKFFMRLSVVIGFCCVYVTACLLLTSKMKTRNLALALLMFNPGLLLIDNAHFQYNSISLGFFIVCVNFLITNQLVLGSVFFCLALNYKQMELYHALPIFCYLLSICCECSISNFCLKISKIGLTVIFSFAIIWLPFMQNTESVLQVVSRLFPLNRGLFEDKVANIWCTLNNVAKIRLLFDQSQLAVLSASLTLLASLPSCILVFKQRNIKNFFTSLTSTALSFFLFSYQVHEKSILLFSIPLTLLVEYTNCHLVIHYLTVCSLSMSHLYFKDEFLLSATSYNLLFSIFLHFICSDNSKRGTTDYKSLIIVSWSGFLAIILLMVFGPIPKKLPDIYIVLLCAYSFVHFFVFYLATLLMTWHQFCSNVMPKVKRS